MNTENLVVVVEGEPRVDSRYLAKELAIEHESLIRIIEKYFNDFSEFGHLRFEIGKLLMVGRPPQFTMLNEDQCYFALTLVRNSKKSVILKKKLVQEFGRLRRSERGFSSRPQFSTIFHPILRFPVVGRQEDLLMKRTRNTYTSVLNELGFRTSIYKQVLTNNVSRILIGMPVRPFRRLHGIPAGSRRRTRLFYDSNLRRAMDEVEQVACIQLQEDRLSSFEEIEQVVYQVARTILQYSTMRRVNLLEHVPESELEDIAS